MGTPVYMAPEQARGAPPAPGMDAWALGAIAFHVLEGEPPYPGLPLAELVTRVAAGERRPLLRAREWLRPDDRAHRGVGVALVGFFLLVALAADRRGDPGTDLDLPPEMWQQLRTLARVSFMRSQVADPLSAPTAFYAVASVRPALERWRKGLRPLRRTPDQERTRETLEALERAGEG